MSPSSVLDIGAGPGRLSVMVAKQFPNAEFYTVDPSEYMVRVENKNFEKAGIKATCKPGSSREIPYERKFDLIFTTLSFHHWENRDSSISYILSKLSGRGTFLIIEFMEDNYKSPDVEKKADELIKKLERSQN